MPNTQYTPMHLHPMPQKMMNSKSIGEVGYPYPFLQVWITCFLEKLYREFILLTQKNLLRPPHTHQQNKIKIKRTYGQA